jgi:hypothetical protein
MVNFQDCWGDQKEDVASNSPKIKSLERVNWKSLSDTSALFSGPNIGNWSTIENLMTVKYIINCKVLRLKQ